MLAVAASGVVRPCRTRPICEPVTVSKFEPEPVYHAGRVVRGNVAVSA